MTRPTVNVALISIIDNDEGMRLAMTGLVRSIGYAARGFKSAEEFLQSPELSETSCIISDVQMPGISGLDLQDKLADQNIATPIIFMSALQADAHTQQRALQAGAVCFLKKPFDDRVLIKCLEKALSQN